MSIYIDPRAEIANNVVIEEGAMIIGPSKVGAGSIIGNHVVLGHPSKATITETHTLRQSIGASIGEGSIIRSGSVIYENVQIKEKFQCGHNTVIREGVSIGSNCAIGNSCIIEWGTTVGDNARFQNCITIGEKVLLGKNIFIGPNVTLTTGRYMLSALVAGGKLTDRDFQDMEKEYLSQPGVIAEDDVRIGANAVVLAGVRLYSGAVVSAGAVISVDVRSGYMAVGNPGRVFVLEKSRKERTSDDGF